MKIFKQKIFASACFQTVNFEKAGPWVCVRDSFRPRFAARGSPRRGRGRGADRGGRELAPAPALTVPETRGAARRLRPVLRARARPGLGRSRVAPVVRGGDRRSVRCVAAGPLVSSPRTWSALNSWEVDVSPSRADGVPTHLVFAGRGGRCATGVRRARRPYRRDSQRRLPRAVERGPWSDLLSPPAVRTGRWRLRLRVPGGRRAPLAAFSVPLWCPRSPALARSSAGPLRAALPRGRGRLPQRAGSAGACPRGPRRRARLFPCLRAVPSLPSGRRRLRVGSARSRLAERSSAAQGPFRRVPPAADASDASLLCLPLPRLCEGNLLFGSLK